MAISFTDRVRVPADVLISGLQNESVILNLKSERYFGLDDISTRFFSLLNSSESVQQAYEALLAEFEVDPEILRRDLVEFLNVLDEKGLVEVCMASD
jgi:hypothetical protein